MNKLFVMIFLLFTSISQIYGANKTLYFKDWSKSPEWGMEMDIYTKAINKKNDSFRIILDDEGNKIISIIIFDEKLKKIFLKQPLNFTLFEGKDNLNSFEQDFVSLEISLKYEDYKTSVMVSREGLLELYISSENKKLEDILSIIRRSSSFGIEIGHRYSGDRSTVYTASYSSKGFTAAEKALLAEYNK